MLSTNQQRTSSMVEPTSAVSNESRIISDSRSWVWSTGLPSIRACNNDDEYDETEKGFCTKMRDLARQNIRDDDSAGLDNINHDENENNINSHWQIDARGLQQKMMHSLRHYQWRFVKIGGPVLENLYEAAEVTREKNQC